MIKSEIIEMAVLGAVVGAIGLFAGADSILNLITDITSMIYLMGMLSIPAFQKLCQTMMYEDEAYLYQSFPVSTLETVVTKVFVIAAEMMVFAVTTSVFNMDILKLLPVGLLMCLCISSIAFFVITVCYTYRSLERKKINPVIVVLLIYILIALEIWAINKFILGSSLILLYQLIILAGIFIFETALLVGISTKALKAYYRV